MLSESPPFRPPGNDQKPDFIYTSAHCDDLHMLKQHYLQIQSIDWCDLDERHPIAANNKYAFPEENHNGDKWLNVEHCLKETDEEIDPVSFRVNVLSC